MSILKSKSGLQAALASAVKGVLITTGDTVQDTWYQIASLGGSTTLPIGKVGAIFKGPKTANKITLAAGDSIYPLTLTVQCKVTAELSNEKGTIDVSDDCSNGYMSSITDGFVNITGSFEQFIKFDETTQKIPAVQKAILSRFYDIVEDTGAGVYTLTPKNDDDLLLFIFLNRKVAIGVAQSCFIIPVILGSANTTEDNKSGMNLSVSWSKAEGWAGLYEAIANTAISL